MNPNSELQGALRNGAPMLTARVMTNGEFAAALDLECGRDVIIPPDAKIIERDGELWVHGWVYAGQTN